MAFFFQPWFRNNWITYQVITSSFESSRGHFHWWIDDNIRIIIVGKLFFFSIEFVSLFEMFLLSDLQLQWWSRKRRKVLFATSYYFLSFTPLQKHGLRSKGFVLKFTLSNPEESFEFTATLQSPINKVKTHSKHQHKQNLYFNVTIELLYFIVHNFQKIINTELAIENCNFRQDSKYTDE